MPKSRCVCRYGCGAQFQYKNLRGRHESMKHGAVWTGAKTHIERMQDERAHTKENPHPTEAPPPAIEQPHIADSVGYLKRALDQLNARQDRVTAELAHMEQLRQEADNITRQIQIISKALSELSITAKIETGRPAQAPSAATA